MNRRYFATILVVLLVVAAASEIASTRAFLRNVEDPRTVAYAKWKTGDSEQRAALTTPVRGRCPGAPFLLPSSGYIALLYYHPRPPYSASQPHQGIDIFSDQGPGKVPVYAAYDGFLTREDHWKSAVIIRVPNDPLQAGRQIWLYYAHMASDDGALSYIEDEFPAGTRERPVDQGDFLGFTGNYAGAAGHGVAVHLHFSIVKDDGTGHYANELDIANTLDPSAYFGMKLHYDCAPVVPRCTNQPSCAAGES